MILKSKWPPDNTVRKRASFLVHADCCYHNFRCGSEYKGWDPKYKRSSSVINAAPKLDICEY
jgi:hypothetical protein